MDHNKLWKILKEMGIHTTLPASWEICMQVRKQQLELDMEKASGSKLGREYIKEPCLIYSCVEYIMWNAGLDEAQAGIRTARRNINNLRYADDTNLMAESEEELKSLLMKVKEKTEKAGLKLNIQKMNIIATSPIVHVKYMWKQWKQLETMFLAPK